VLERIAYAPERPVVDCGKVRWEPDPIGKRIEQLPQLFWADGQPWCEANHWALVRATGTSGADIQTVTNLMKHLAAYASWLEEAEIDWRHFPIRFGERCIVRFRGELIRERDKLGLLKPSTATARMRAVLQFYRHARSNGFVGPSSALWSDKQVVVRFHDSVGFERALHRQASELAIPNRRRPGVVLEDGLTPLSPEHTQQTLAFAKTALSPELHYMFSLGFLSGPRIGTISTLCVRNLEPAVPDPAIPALSRIAVGPGTGVQTKFDVVGNLLVPTILIDELKRYAYSVRRLKRQALASKEDGGLLFLTARGKPYGLQSFERLMTDVRRCAVLAGLRFLARFKFHQSRATFGTMLMKLALQVADPSSALEFVKEAMLHKDEEATLKYIRFVQTAAMKELISSEFAAAFSGVVSRDWSKFSA
jgi:integrase